MAENTYLTALQGMKDIFPDAENIFSSFNRKYYSSTFLHYYEERVPVYQALETGYTSAIDKEQYIINMAAAVVEAASAQLESLNNKSKKEHRLMDLNLCMISYVLPGILKYHGECSDPLCEELLKAWKERFPKTNLSMAPYEDIEAGFHKKFCYITTAVCECFGKPDDCYELTLLRNYRDEYLQKQPKGEEMIRRYYDVAPTIVRRIDRQPDREQIYQEVWDSYLKPCISLIEQDENESCCDLYLKMVDDLQEKYFFTDSSR